MEGYNDAVTRKLQNILTLLHVCMSIFFVYIALFLIMSLSTFMH